MIDPSIALFQAVLSAILPTFLGMAGSICLGVALGASLVPRVYWGEGEVNATLRERVRHEKDVRLKQEAEKERKALESEVNALNTQIVSLKMLLASARRGENLDKERKRKEDAATLPDAARLAELEGYAARFPALLKEVEELRSALEELSGAPPASTSSNEITAIHAATDELQLVEGIGPKIAEQLRKKGFRTWADVAGTEPKRLREVLDEAGDHFHMHDPTTWPEQCKLMVENRWEELRKYQGKLNKVR